MLILTMKQGVFMTDLILRNCKQCRKHTYPANWCTFIYCMRSRETREYFQFSTLYIFSNYSINFQPCYDIFVPFIVILTPTNSNRRCSLLTGQWIVKTCSHKTVKNILYLLTNKIRHITYIIIQVACSLFTAIVANFILAWRHKDT